MSLGINYERKHIAFDIEHEMFLEKHDYKEDLNGITFLNKLIKIC